MSDDYIDEDYEEIEDLSNDEEEKSDDVFENLIEDEEPEETPKKPYKGMFEKAREKTERKEEEKPAEREGIFSYPEMSRENSEEFKEESAIPVEERKDYYEKKLINRFTTEADGDKDLIDEEKELLKQYFEKSINNLGSWSILKDLYHKGSNFKPLKMGLQHYIEASQKLDGLYPTMKEDNIHAMKRILGI